VMIIIVWSLVYYCVVFFSEVFGSMGLENNRYFLSLLVLIHVFSLLFLDGLGGS